MFIRDEIVSAFPLKSRKTFYNMRHMSLKTFYTYLDTYCFIISKIFCPPYCLVKCPIPCNSCTVDYVMLIYVCVFYDNKSWHQETFLYRPHPLYYIIILLRHIQTIRIPRIRLKILHLMLKFQVIGVLQALWC